MAGIYIHIPFCRQACHYCNFHFSTSLRYKNELLAALLKEMEIQSGYLDGEPVETIYVGGGTPSLLEPTDLRSLLSRIMALFPVPEQPEITIEVNPDDITEAQLFGWKEAGVNRLSIGIQSFFDEDLEWMNRAHNSSQAVAGLELAIRYFSNISADLIYGSPLLSDEKWKENVEKLIAFRIPHLSCYALTVEPKTPLYKMIREHRSPDINPDKQSGQFLFLMDWMAKAGYEHYEISNFAKPGYRSRHNSSYWQGKKYLGLGPSAHSYNGNSRQWNVSNNQTYMDEINKGLIKCEKENLTESQRLNEYIMTSLRTMEGLELSRIGQSARQQLDQTTRKYIETGLMKKENDFLQLTKEGKLLADGIAANLFF